MTPAGAGGRHRHPHPAGGLVVHARADAGMLFRALPMELNLDAAVLVGMHFSGALRPGIAAGWPHHGGGLHAQTGGLGVSGAGISRGQRNAAALGLDGGAERRGVSLRAQVLRQIPRQIVARLKALAGDNKLAFLLRVILMRGVVVQTEPLTRQQAAHRAAAAEGLGLQIVGLLPQHGVAAQLLLVPGVIQARRIVMAQAALQGLTKLALLHPAGFPALLGEHRLVIVTGQRAGAGDNLARGFPAGQAVLFLGGVAAVEAHPLQRRSRQGVGIVKDGKLHPRPVLLQVAETPGVTLFMQQADDEIVIALAVLQRITAARPA